jgi:hypothetical protein
MVSLARVISLLPVVITIVRLVSSTTVPEIPTRVGSVESMTSMLLESQGRLMI